MISPEIDVFTDGCCEPVNPGGTAAYGVVIYMAGNRLWEKSEIFKPGPLQKDQTSNNVAEYLGLKAALIYLLQEQLNNKLIRVSGDSKLVIYQMFGRLTRRGWRKWKIHAGLYVPHARECQKLLKEFPNICGRWIPREQNSIADELSKRELKRAGVEFRLQPDM